MNRIQTLTAWLLGVSVAVVASSCATAAEKTTAELTILHTSDLHGAVLPFNDYANRPSDRGSLAQIATLVEEIFSRRLGRPVAAGEIVVADVDTVMSHDNTTPLAIENKRRDCGRSARASLVPRHAALPICHRARAPSLRNRA